MKYLLIAVFSLTLLFNSITHSFWQYISSGIGGNFPVCAIHSSGNYIFAGTNLFSEGRLYRSSNNGSGWSGLNLTGIDIFSLCAENEFLFAGTEHGIYRSKNFGLNWEHSLNVNDFYTCILTYNSPSHIVAGCFDNVNGYGKIVVSTDYGSAWVSTDLNNNAVLSLAKNGNTLYAGTNVTGLYRSTNGGFNWIHSALNVNCVNSVTSTGNYLFVGSNMGLYRSTNNGNTWSLTSITNTTIYALANYNNVIFAGVSDIANFYYSTNYGQSWISKNDGLLDIEYSSVRTIHIANGYIFIGTSNSNYDGVYRRPLSEIISVQQISELIPRDYSLSQNYPNPFNPVTYIEFDIPKASYTQLIVYDALGSKIEKLVDKELAAGKYKADWNASDYPSGVYYYKLTAGIYTETKKMILVK